MVTITRTLMTTDADDQPCEPWVLVRYMGRIAGVGFIEDDPDDMFVEMPDGTTLDKAVLIDLAEVLSHPDIAEMLGITQSLAIV